MKMKTHHGFDRIVTWMSPMLLILCPVLGLARPESVVEIPSKHLQVTVTDSGYRKLN